MRQVEARSGVALVPVLEVEPWHFSSTPLPHVAGSRAHPAEWADYFRRCMADAGFTDIVPLAEGSHFVSARSLIGNALLERLVREAVDGTGLAADRIPRLSGGVALVADGKALLEPSCCGDLENLRSWEQLVAHQPASGSLWIGHPELAFSLSGDLVTLTEQWEYPPAPDYLLEVTTPLDQLRAAVAQARLEVERLRAELVPVVTRVLGSPRPAKRVTDALIGPGPISS